MSNAASPRPEDAGNARALAPQGRAPVVVILVERAENPLYRNEQIDGKIIRCGLGRTLECMDRYDPGVDVEVLVVINEASAPARVAESSTPSERVWRPLRRWAEGRYQRRNERRNEQRRAMYAQLPRKHPFISGVFFRDGRGHDLGAYDFGYQLLLERGYRGDVVFMSSCVVGPYEHGWLAKYRSQFRRHPRVGLCGIGLNSHDTSAGDGPFAPHVQSYFLYTNMQVLSDAVGPRLLEADVSDELDVIRRGEIGVSQRVLDAGYSITSPVFPEFAYRRGEPWSLPRGDLRYCRRLGLPINAI
jgi:hypothetical protein